MTDLNGDGRDDVLNVAPHSLEVWFADASGALGKRVGNTPYSPWVGPVADFTGDGLADALASKGDHWQVLVNEGNGSFKEGPISKGTCNGNCHDLLHKTEVGDFNGDGNMDLLVRGTRLATWLGRGDGQFDNFVSSNNICIFLFFTLIGAPHIQIP